ncbi:unnamed protein product [Bathycoccus prasinos]
MRYGGGQEFEAAKAAILAVVKNANVVPNRVDKYPITVTIEEEQLGMIYSGRQQGFFREKRTTGDARGGGSAEE